MRPTLVLAQSVEFKRWIKEKSVKKIFLIIRWNALFGILLVLVGCAPKYSTIADFQEQLARDVARKNSGADGKIPEDFQVFSTQSVDPIGTLYRPSTSIPIVSSGDSDACKPKRDPEPREAPGLFPSSYQVNKGLAFDLGLNETVFKYLATLGVNVGKTDELTFGITEPSRQVLDDESMRALLEKTSCLAVLKKQKPPVAWVVRGYISGIRDFSVTSGADVRFEGVTKVGNFKIEPIKGSGTVAVKDEKRTNFLQILAQVSPQPQSTTVDIKSIPTTPPTTASWETPPSWDTLDTTGIVYIQIDKSDISTDGDDLSKKLKQSSINVAGGIERIQSTRMPKVTQVRYFNGGDKGKAEEIQAILKEKRPDTALVRLGLPAPKGQLEIWLTKN
jgi:hypothetical protein